MRGLPSSDQHPAGRDDRRARARSPTQPGPAVRACHQHALALQALVVRVRRAAHFGRVHRPPAADRAGLPSSSARAAVPPRPPPAASVCF